MSAVRGAAALRALACLAAACAPGDGGGRGGGEPWFEEVAERAGIDFVHAYGERRYWFPEIMGAGLGFADLDEDGFLDLYVVQSGDLARPDDALGADRLYRNRTDGTFEDVTAEAGTGDRGYGMGCAMADADDDGRIDVYVTNLGPNVLYHNRGAARFEDVTEHAGVGDQRWSTSAAFLDSDADGDLDLYVANYVNWSKERELQCSGSHGLRDYCSPKNYAAPAADALYRNDGGLAFADVSAASGIARSPAHGLGVVCGDFDQDGHADVYVANDQMPNQLWLGRGDGTFQDGALLAGCAVDANGKAEASMGCVAFDHGDDGDLDLFMTHLNGETNTFYEKVEGAFTDRTDAHGLGLPSLSSTGFGVGGHDFDHDGNLDLFVVNGRVTRDPAADGPDEFGQPSTLLRGLASGRFEEVTPTGGTRAVLIGASRGAAFGDYDNDGDVDVAYSNNGGPLRLLENVAGSRGHWIELRVVERGGSDALGASVRVERGERGWSRMVQAAYSYCSSNDPRVHVGLGGEDGAVAVSVRWKDGERERYGPLDVDRRHVVQRGEGR